MNQVEDLCWIDNYNSDNGNMNKPARFTSGIFLLLFSFISLSIINAQEIKHCGSTEFRNDLIKNHPEILQREKEIEDNIQQYIHSSLKNQETTIYVIPIVFHIIHQYGSEDISDAQVLDAVRILNLDYRKLNPDTADIVSVYKPLAADCQIEFRLAKIDPLGNCTNGIDRINSYRTDFANENSKLNQWDRSKYLNIWVVATIGTTGVAGYSIFPSNVLGIDYVRDGVIILNDYVGSIGTSTPRNARALTHEIGHYLNLAHPWGLSNSPGVDCGDDNVVDTPPTKGSKLNCNLNLHSCDSSILDNVQNYMDYSYCSNMFTQGQKARMIAVLNSKVAGRNNLWTATNLKATGTDVPSPATCSPIADFYPNTYFVCQGSGITFQDASWNADIVDRTWVFTGTATPSSTLRSPTIIFDSLNWQTVSLTASNSVGSDTKIKSDFIFVSPTNTDYTGSFSESFENDTTFQNQWFVVNHGNNKSKWHISKSAAYSGGASLFLNAYNPVVMSTNTNPPVVVDPGIGLGDVDDVISPSFDLSNTGARYLNFRHSYASLSSSAATVTEALRLYYSSNCGQTWSLFITKRGTSLINAGWLSSSFTPKSPSQWMDHSFRLPDAVFKPNVRFKIEFTNGSQSNNFYIDDFNLSASPLGIEDQQNDNFGFSVFPNPTNIDPTITYNLSKNQNVKMELYDILGHQIKELVNEQQSQGEHSFNLSKDGLSEGVYFIKFLAGDDVMVFNKLIIIQ